MDGIYLANKFGKPTTYDQWLSVRDIADYVCTVWQEKDMVSQIGNYYCGGAFCIQHIR